VLATTRHRPGEQIRGQQRAKSTCADWLVLGARAHYRSPKGDFAGVAREFIRRAWEISLEVPLSGVPEAGYLAIRELMVHKARRNCLDIGPLHQGYKGNITHQCHLRFGGGRYLTCRIKVSNVPAIRVIQARVAIALFILATVHLSVIDISTGPSTKVAVRRPNPGKLGKLGDAFRTWTRSVKEYVGGVGFGMSINTNSPQVSLHQTLYLLACGLDSRSILE
jgi:hypothetical protein